jgi:hypothetical protein
LTFIATLSSLRLELKEKEKGNQFHQYSITKIAVVFPITIAVAIAVPGACPDTTTVAPPPPPTKFSKLEYIINVQHTYFITFKTGFKR